MDIAQPDHAPEPGPYYPAPAPIWAAAAGTAIASNVVIEQLRAFGQHLMVPSSPYRVILTSLPGFEVGQDEAGTSVRRDFE